MKRSRFIMRAAAILLALSLFILAPGNLYNAEAADVSDTAVKKLEDSLARAVADKAAAEKAMAEAQNNKAGALAEKYAVDSQLRANENILAILNDLITQYDADIAAAEKAAAEAERNIDAQYKALIARLRYSYEEGPSSYLELLLESKGLTDFLSRLDTVRSFLEYDRSVIKNYSETKRDLEELHDSLVAMRASKEERRDELEANKEELAEALALSESIIERFDKELSIAKADYMKAAAAEQQLQADMAKIIAERQKKTNSSYVGGDLLWPLNGYYNITDGFGWRIHPITGKRQFHNSVDIPAPYGTSIMAANSGTVVETKYHYADGYYILIDHGGGTATFYSHLSYIGVTAGDYVTRGEVIGRVGATGFATGNHLNFSVYVNSEAVDPMQFFK